MILLFTIGRSYSTHTHTYKHRTNTILLTYRDVPQCNPIQDIKRIIKEAWWSTNLSSDLLWIF